MKKFLFLLVLFLSYVGWNEYRFRDYSEVRSDAIIGVHYPGVAEQIRIASGQGHPHGK